MPVVTVTEPRLLGILIVLRGHKHRSESLHDMMDKLTSVSTCFSFSERIDFIDQLILDTVGGLTQTHK